MTEPGLQVRIIMLTPEQTDMLRMIKPVDSLRIYIGPKYYERNRREILAWEHRNTFATGWLPSRNGWWRFRHVESNS